MNMPATLFGLFGPFLVWPLELFFPYPHIVEEIFKFIVVYYFLKSKPDFKTGFKTVALAGILFAASETVFYSLKANLGGVQDILITRFIFTSLLHTITFAVIFIFGSSPSPKRKNVGLVLGLLTAILIHYLYNSYI